MPQSVCEPGRPQTRSLLESWSLSNRRSSPCYGGTLCRSGLFGSGRWVVAVQFSTSRRKFMCPRPGCDGVPEIELLTG